MTTDITRHTDDFATCGQLLPQDVATLAQQGYHTLINNRPDGEGGPDQPANEEIARVAREHGLHYVYLPVVSGAISAAQVQAMADALSGAQPPVLAFCRSGARSTQLWQMATGQIGTPTR